MLHFKDYYLLRENTEEIPSDFKTNIKNYIEKLPTELQMHFAVQCAEYVLPKWEEWASSSNLTQEQKDAPKLAIESAKAGNVDSRASSRAYDSAFRAFNSIHNPHDPANIATKSRIATAAAYAAVYAAGHSISFYGSSGTYGIAVSSAIRAGMTIEDVYNIYLKLLKTQNIKQHMPENYHFTPDLITMIKAAQQDPHQMPILADKLEDHGFNNQEILAHLRDPNVHWASNDWIFKQLLGK